MRAMCNAPAMPQGVVGHSTTSGLLATAKRWWLAYIAWRIERAAVHRLWSMTDHELKDIGLIRSQILTAVRGEIARSHVSGRG